ncbi:glycoside hydrolase [Linderina pennispora]|uniref:Glycoside hydrolase n=1 Tax=Linderina pennispora TaxID=61395 RepID=A0A1Y1W599_9FUNG|nr:glycoside hydrolase [Linderina pennispora]ORX68568.1 glycoside hydrolase [Linderina pennispora]
MHRPRKIAYYPAWAIYDRKFNPADVPVERLTHINYGFANLVNNKIALGDPWADVEKPWPDTQYQPGDIKGSFGEFNNPASPVRRRNPHLRSIISVGGWTWSAGFSKMTSAYESRMEFIRSVGEFLQKYQFDGVDIDWEHPVEGGMEGNPHSPADATNYAHLLYDLRTHLDSLPPPRFGRYEISISTSAARSVYRHLDLAAIAHVVDTINIMTYDYAGAWSPTTAHQQNLFESSLASSGITGDTTVSDYIRAGVPPEKVVLGIGFYGRGFAHVKHEQGRGPVPGLGCPFSGVPKGTWEDGVFDYKALRADQMLANSSYTPYWDDRAQAPVLYSEKECVLITFDDPVSVSWKADYVLRRRLGGVMIWEITQDYNSELLAKICEYLG